MGFQFVNGTKIIEKYMGKNPLVQACMLTYYRPIVTKEVALSSTTREEKILCVGGGYFPCTAILFHQLTGAKVTVIDIDPLAVEASTKLVAQLGLSEVVTVSLSDGNQVNVSEFDVIHIAMQVSPKEDIFNYIRSNMQSHAKILIRTPKHHLERGYQPFVELSDHWVKQSAYSNIERTLLYGR